jgi:hypothetical protein
MKEKADSANVREALANLGMVRRELWKLREKTLSWFKKNSERL